MASEKDSAAPLAPYMPFKTFRTGVDTLAEGLPERIDASVFKSMSGTAQKQLFGSLRFFGLVDAELRTQPMLARLVESPADGRQQIVRGLLEDAYAAIFALDFNRITPAQLEEAFGQYKVGGETRRKAISFFAQGCAYAGIELPTRLFGARIGSGTSGGQRRAPRVKRQLKPAKIEQGDGDKGGGGYTPPPVDQGDRKTVPLRSAGAVTLIVNLVPFETSIEDRQWVFDLVDSLTTYERGADKPVRPATPVPNGSAAE